MIRATNTIKHLDVKPRLFEEREAGREGGSGTSKKNIQTPMGESAGGIKPPVLNLCAVLGNKFRAAAACVIFMYASVHSCALCQCVAVHRSSV